MPSGCWTIRGSISRSRRDVRVAQGGRASGYPGRKREELAQVYGRLKASDRPVLEEGSTTCCYAKSEKSWISDPDGVVGRLFSPAANRRSMATAPSSGPCRTALKKANAAFPRSRHEREPQRPVPVHRQFGALDPGRSHPQQGRERSDFAPFRRAAFPTARSIPRRFACSTSSAMKPPASARKAGTSSLPRARRRSISSSPSATMPPAKPAPYGRAGRFPPIGGIEDPAVEDDSQPETFWTAYQRLKRRIDLLLALPLGSIDELALARRVREIGRTADAEPVKLARAGECPR
jgi:hypothetical protein